MRYRIDHDYHIHSSLSTCSNDPLQTKERILRYAEEYGLHTVCLTNHYWDSEVDGCSEWYFNQNFEHVSKALPLPQSEKVKFLFGCETEMDKFMRLGMPLKRFDDFEFVILPTTHMHIQLVVTGRAIVGSSRGTLGGKTAKRFEYAVAFSQNRDRAFGV